MVNFIDSWCTMSKQELKVALSILFSYLSPISNFCCTSGFIATSWCLMRKSIEKSTSPPPAPHPQNYDISFLNVFFADLCIWVQQHQSNLIDQIVNWDQSCYCKALYSFTLCNYDQRSKSNMEDTEGLWFTIWLDELWWLRSKIVGTKCRVARQGFYCWEVIS